MPTEPYLDIATLFGAALKNQRVALGLSQDALAAQLRQNGLVPWTRDMVASTEIGRRTPNLDEAVVISLTVRISLADLLFPETAFLVDDLYVRLGAATADQPRVAIGVFRSDVRAVLTGGPGFDVAWHHHFAAVFDAVDAMGADFEGALEPTQFGAFWDRKRQALARGFGMPYEELDATAHRLWGRGVDEEQDRRVEQRVSRPTTPRIIGAIRGHVMRELRAEVQAARETGEINGNGS